MNRKKERKKRKQNKKKCICQRCCIHFLFHRTQWFQCCFCCRVSLFEFLCGVNIQNSLLFREFSFTLVRIIINVCIFSICTLTHTRNFVCISLLSPAANCLLLHAFLSFRFVIYYVIIKGLLNYQLSLINTLQRFSQRF